MLHENHRSEYRGPNTGWGDKHALEAWWFVQGNIKFLFNLHICEHTELF